MTLVVDVQTTGARIPLSRARVVEIASAVLAAERVRRAFLSITFVSPGTMAGLNRRHLRHRGATDVIAFGFERAARGARVPVMGDIYIAPAVARRHARELRRPVREEIARLVVHGTLHVLGYDHPDGAERTASRMWRRQEVLLGRALGVSS
ncbi:MAG TPA: rRNA maturation RNase YbeY [Gemmatimonadaceae bacterium]|nr:rRNA maturation RNase YbeY [Gemmatimonadaceae bacterium]